MAGISSDMTRLRNPILEPSTLRSAVSCHPIATLRRQKTDYRDGRQHRGIWRFFRRHFAVGLSSMLELAGQPFVFLKRDAEIIARNSAPELVVLSVGINDAGADAAAFGAAYLAVLHSIHAPVVLASITPTRDYDVDRLNNVIRGLGGYSTIEFKELRSDMTTDGIHLNQAGYKLWTAALVQAIETNLGCSK